MKGVRMGLLVVATVLFTVVLFTPAWILNFEIGTMVNEGEKFGLFDLAKIAEYSFDTEIITLIAVFIVIALVASVASILLCWQNDFKKKKLCNAERGCTVVLTIVNLLLLIFLTIYVVTNSKEEVNMLDVMIAVSLIPSRILWIASAVGFVTGVIATICANKNEEDVHY